MRKFNSAKPINLRSHLYDHGSIARFSARVHDERREFILMTTDRVNEMKLTVTEAKALRKWLDTVIP